MKASKPRKTLGVLESTALFCLMARECAEHETTAADLHAEFSRFGTRDVSESGLYLLLECLERKGLIERVFKLNVDSLGRSRQVRFYAMTSVGRRVAEAEYQVQVSILDAARSAFEQMSA